MLFKEKFKINSIWDFEHNTDKSDEMHHIIIGSINGKYGIKDNENNILLPFEYDNITRTDLEVLQICKSGKLGLVRIETDFLESDYLLGIQDRGRFSIENIIPCEFDSIFRLNDSLILLYNYHHTGQKIWAYFVCADKLTECYYLGYDMVDEKEYLINMYRNGKAYLIDYRTGHILREKWR